MLFMVRLGEMGRMGWIVSVLVVLAGLALVGWRYALASNAVALLDWGDRQFGGTRGYVVALANGHYGPLAPQQVEVIVPADGSGAAHGLGDAGAARAVVVFIHGGGWHSGRPGDYRFVGRTLARKGYVVVLVGYRLVPDGVYPKMLEDCAGALAWVRSNIAAYGGDPDRVILMGHSAGAYNAVMLALERQWLGRVGVPDRFIKGVIGLSGPYDFYPFTSDSARAAFGLVAEPELTQPVRFVRGDAPAMLLITGDKDEAVKPRNSLVLARALGRAGSPTEPVIVAGADHVDTIMKLAAPFSRDRRVIDPVLAFLSAQAGASALVQARPR